MAFRVSLIGIVLILACVVTDARAQVLRRDPSVEPAPLAIAGREYKPVGQAKLGPVRLHAFASFRCTWDDNIFLAPPYAQKDDFLLLLNGGLRGEWRMGRNETSLSYQALSYNYARHARENHLGHDLALDSSWTFDWWFLDARAGFSQTRYPDPDELDVNSDRAKLYADLRTGAYCERIGIEIGYRLNDYDFIDPAMVHLDHLEQYATVEGYYLLREDSKLAQKVYAYVGVTYGAFFYEERILSDSDQLSGYIGVKGMLFDRLACNLAIGYAGIDLAGNGADPTDDRLYRGLYYKASVQYNIDDEKSVSLSSSRSLQYTGNSNYRVFDRASLAYQHAFIDKIYAKASVFLDHADPSNARNLTRMGCTLECEVFVKEWLAVAAGWNFVTRTARRDPALASANYRQHQLWLNLVLYF